MTNKSSYSILKTISAIFFAGGVAAFFLPFIKVTYGLENAVSSVGNWLSSAFGFGQAVSDSANNNPFNGFEVLKGLITGDPDFSKLSTVTPLAIVIIAIFAVAALGIVFGFVPALKKLASILMPIFGIAGAALLMVLSALLYFGLSGDIVNKAVNTAGSMLNAFGLGGIVDVSELGNSAEVQIGFWVSFGAFVAAAVLAFVALKAYSSIGQYEELGEGDASIIGVVGMYKGITFPIASDEELIIGRDAMLSHIVITDSAEKISRKHITVSFDTYDNVYTVTDHSSNGTYLADGTRLVANIPVKLQRGTVIYLAKRDNTFKLG